ncbi:MAG: hypothetical protein AMXMBFR42_11550 [Burkholderiales bacterium]
MSVSDFQTGGNATRPPRNLPSPEHDLTLWWCPLDTADDDVPALRAILSQEELARANRFGTEALRRRYIAGRAALRKTLAVALGIGAASVPIQRGPRGRPVLLPSHTLDFNVTHTEGVAIIAHLARPGWRVGVDVESLGRDVSHDALARKFLTERERSAVASLDDDARRIAFLRRWTCKEAMSKATGDGLSAPFRDIGIDVVRGLAPMEGSGDYDPSRWSLRSVAVGRRLMATVALWSSGP